MGRPVDLGPFAGDPFHGVLLSGSRGACRLRETTIRRFPVEIAEPGIDIFGGLRAVIHVEAVLVHIERSIGMPAAAPCI